MRIKSVTTILGLVMASYLLVACNTAEGVGKDVEKGGEAIQDSAKDVKRKM